MCTQIIYMFELYEYVIYKCKIINMHVILNVFQNLWKKSFSNLSLRNWRLKMAPRFSPNQKLYLQTVSNNFVFASKFLSSRKFCIVFKEPSLPSRFFLFPAKLIILSNSMWELIKNDGFYKNDGF